MKYLVSTLLIFTYCFGLSPFLLQGQSPRLNVEGHAKIRGNIDIGHNVDSSSIFIGKGAGPSHPLASSGSNTFVGTGSGYGFDLDQHNSFFGRASGVNNRGNYNAFFGSFSGYLNSGYANSFFGSYAGSGNRAGSRNTFIGFSSGPVTTGDTLDQAIAIGHKAKVNCSNCAVIGGTGIEAVNVGVNTHTPTERLDINGNARIRAVGTGAFKYPLSLANNGVLTTDASDFRLKENIADITEALEKTLALKGVTYNWKSDVDKEPRIGLIAQEVEAVLPEVVYTNEVDGYMGVRYKEIVSLLIEAIKEQQASFELMKKEIDLLRQENILLKTEMQKMKSQMTDLSTLQIPRK